MIENKYYLKILHNHVYIEYTWYDESEPKEKKRHKAKYLPLGKIGDPFFLPEDWIKKLIEK